MSLQLATSACRCAWRSLLGLTQIIPLAIRPDAEQNQDDGTLPHPPFPARCGIRCKSHDHFGTPPAVSGGPRRVIPREEDDNAKVDVARGHDNAATGERRGGRGL